ncbi:MAG TPA: FHA domain-containing protein [Acidimicrobiales bacterium]
MAYVFCNQCGHRNPPGSNFCSSCGGTLDVAVDERTIVLHAIDPLQDAPGPSDDTVVHFADLSAGTAVLLVRSGHDAGLRLLLDKPVTSLGRHPDSDVLLDDITVSRRHAEITRGDKGWIVRDAGSLNGTYLNQSRIDESAIRQGDELQIGKYRMVFLEGPDQS